MQLEIRFVIRVRGQPSECVLFLYQTGKQRNSPTSCKASYGGFLQLGVPFWGVPIIRTRVFWGLYLGALILGKLSYPSTGLGIPEALKQA